jgi:tRNA pseudouridine55 synthase
MVLLIDKPYDWTSFDVVRKIRRLIKIKKIGHAGTLDPLATGLLIMCTGKFTKRINEYMAREKEYTGTITLGAVTPTYDLESEPQAFKDASHLTQQDVENAAAQLTGDIMQIPPIYSAIKKDGKRAYELARRGDAVELDARKINVSKFDVSLKDSIVSFRIVCSTGTYIRSLAHDLGQLLGCGAYLSSLCRTRIGEFKIEDAWNMEEAERRIRELT